MLDTFLFGFDVVLGYLLGSISSAVIVSKIFDLPDPRAEGSKNPGATNVLRLAGKKYAIIVMVVDVLKGTLPVVIARLIGPSDLAAASAGFAAVFGHMYPVYFGFKGGKGVATALGAFFGLNFLFGTAVAATWLIVVNVTGYSSLASMIAVSLAPFYSFYALQTISTFTPIFFIMIFVLFKHRDNITRLMDGEEPKVQWRKFVSKDIEIHPEVHAGDSDEVTAQTLKEALEKTKQQEESEPKAEESSDEEQTPPSEENQDKK